MLINKIIAGIFLAAIIFQWIVYFAIAILMFKFDDGIPLKLKIQMILAAAAGPLKDTFICDILFGHLGFAY